MRRKDREITSMEEILQIVESCEVLRIGLSDPDDPAFPYVVPLNFGYAWNGQQLCFYVHGAKAGRKFELMQRMGCCSFEMEGKAEIAFIHSSRDITTRYESVMGKATLTLLEGDAALHGLEALLARREDTRTYDWNRSYVPHTAVWQLTVTEITAKRNSPTA